MPEYPNDGLSHTDSLGRRVQHAQPGPGGAEGGKITETKTQGATTAGKGLGSKGTALGDDAPKQKDYPDMASWMKALREHREGQRAKDPVKAAVNNMVKESGQKK